MPFVYHNKEQWEDACSCNSLMDINHICYSSKMSNFHNEFPQFVGKQCIYVQKQEQWR